MLYILAFKRVIQTDCLENVIAIFNSKAIWQIIVFEKRATLVRVVYYFFFCKIIVFAFKVFLNSWKKFEI